MFFIPVIREEMVGQPLTCASNAERFPFETTSIAVSGLGGAAKNLTGLAAAGNPAIIDALNSFDIWRNANAATNNTVFSLLSTARQLNSFQIARAAAVVAGNENATIADLDSIIATASTAFSTAAGIPLGPPEAFQTSLNQAVRASALMGLANFLVGNPLPITYVCALGSGEEFVAGVLQFECRLIDDARDRIPLTFLLVDRGHP